MSIKKWYQTGLILLALSFSFNGALANSEAFSSVTYSQAQDQAKKDGKILIVDFMATWCPPCKKMERETWVNPDVNDWIKKNAVAVQIDVDKDEKTSQDLGIEAMPTVIIFKDGKEVGREVGYQSPEELLKWLNNAKGPKPSDPSNKAEQTENIFSGLTFAQAKEQAQKDGKILIVDFMATWCPPCKKMESTTWADPDVNDWVKKNAIAVQIDVDKNRKTSRDLEISAMPTIVLFKPDGGGKEFARLVGYQGPTQFLEWMTGIKNTKGDASTVKVPDTEIWDTMSKARNAMLEKKNAQAQEKYLSLWNELNDEVPVTRDLRRKVLPVEVMQLIAQYPEAKPEWVALRDKAEKENKRTDWLILNGMLQDNAKIVAWFDKAKTDPTQRKTIEELGPYLEHALFAGSRWADACDYLYPRPLEKIQEYNKVAERMKHPGPDTEVSKDLDPLPSMVLLIYGAYVGAGRDADAKKIYDECVRLDNTDTMRQALDSMGKGMQAARAHSGKIEASHKK